MFLFWAKTFRPRDLLQWRLWKMKSYPGFSLLPIDCSAGEVIQLHVLIRPFLMVLSRAFETRLCNSYIVHLRPTTFAPPLDSARLQQQRLALT
jgi:hypothetical protein